MSEIYEIKQKSKRVEEDKGKEDKKYPTRPQVIFYSYRVRKSSGKGKYFPPVLICSTRSYTVLPLLGVINTIFYYHYEHKSKLNSLDAGHTTSELRLSIIDIRIADIYLGISSLD